MVNQAPDEGCLSRATIESEGSLFTSHEGFLSRGSIATEGPLFISSLN